MPIYNAKTDQYNNLYGWAVNASLASQTGKVPVSTYSQVATQQNQLVQQTQHPLQGAFDQYEQSITPWAGHTQVQQAYLDHLANPLDSQGFLNQAYEQFWLWEAQKALDVYGKNITDIEWMQEWLKEYLEWADLSFTAQERRRVEEARGGKLREQLAGMVKWYEAASGNVKGIRDAAMEALKLKQADRESRAKDLEKMISLLEVSDHQKEIAKMKLQQAIKDSERQDVMQMKLFESDIRMNEYYKKMELETALKLDQAKRDILEKADFYIPLHDRDLSLSKITNYLSKALNKPEYRGIPVEWGIEWVAVQMYDLMRQGYDYPSILSLFMDELNMNEMVKARATWPLQDSYLKELNIRQKERDLAKPIWGTSSTDWGIKSVRQNVYIDKDWRHHYELPPWSTSKTFPDWRVQWYDSSWAPINYATVTTDSKWSQTIQVLSWTLAKEVKSTNTWSTGGNSISNFISWVQEVLNNVGVFSEEERAYIDSN